MATQKEHHYIPQFFFRNFSRHSDRRRINLLLVRDNRVVFDAKIGKQAKRHKLYLTPEIEAALSQIENGIANGLRSIIAAFPNFQTIRDSESIFYSAAGAFMLQATRLPVRGERQHNAIAPLFREIAANELITRGELPNDVRSQLATGEQFIDYDYRYDVLEAVHCALLVPLLFFDMTLALLVNATSNPFIFSDGPAVSSNLFLWDARDIQGITGLGARGLIAVLPISDLLALMFFDGGIYQCTVDARHPVYLNSDADVGLLNALQVHSAEDVLYFGDKESAEYVERLNRAHRPIASAERYVVRTAYSTTGASELVHHFERPPEIRPEFSFLRVRRRSNDDDRRLPRNETLMSQVETLQRASKTQDSTFTLQRFETTMSTAFAETSDLRQRS